MADGAAHWSEREWHTAVCAVLIAVFACGVLTAQLTGSLRLAYGRYAGDMAGPKVNGRLDWFGHGASLAVLPLLVSRGDAACAASWVNAWLLWGMFAAHYFNRSVVFALRIRAPKPIPLGTLVSTFGFCLLNGYVQGRHLTAFHAYPAEWVWTPQFLLGVPLFYLGMYINISSDAALCALRAPGETGYKIPRGGLFDYVSGANFFGEIVEWSGFALASWSLPGATFAVTTVCSIAPRALHHHAWYRQKFDDYPPSRRALIPFVL